MAKKNKFFFKKMNKPSKKTENETPIPISENRFLQLLVSIVLIGAIFHYLNVILRPLFIATFLYYVIKPLAQILINWRMPHFLVYILIVLLLLLFLSGLGLTVYKNLEQIMQQMPRHEKEFGELIKRFIHLFTSEKESGFYCETGEKVFNQNFTSWCVHNFFGTTTQFLGNILIIFFYFIFLVLEANKFVERVQESLSEEDSRKILRIIKQVNGDINKYLVIKILISLGTAITSGFVMFLFKLDYWILWTILIFFFNFIPYIGPIVACFFPIMFGFLQFQDLYTLIFLSLFLVVLQIIWGNFIEPYFSGQNLNVSPLVLLFFIAYWGWIWGIIGMVLAVPLVLAMRAVLFQTDKTKHLAMLMGSK